jgi:hypothetical protein
MRKLVLDADQLAVETFRPAPRAAEVRGTVLGRESEIPCTNSYTCWAGCISQDAHCFPTLDTCG